MFSKAILAVATAAVLFSAPAQAVGPMTATPGPGWIEAAESLNSAVYFNTASVRRRGSSVYAWTATNYRSPMMNGKVYSVLTHWEIDCNLDRSRALNHVTYSERGGRGQVIDTWDVNEQLRASPPGSVGEVTVRTICSWIR